MNSRDKSILEHILRYCDEVEKTLEIFGHSEDAFKSSFVFRNAISMPIMQIGELATRLSESFIVETPEIPWKAIKGMRTFFAHQYGTMNVDLIWTTAVDRIPELKRNCSQLLETQSEGTEG